VTTPPLTHRELTTACYRPGSGVEPSTCGGALALRVYHDDCVYSTAPPRSVAVEVSQCLGCGIVLSVSEGTLLNAYLPVPEPDPEPERYTDDDLFIDR
jgi:hypothetical protein